ncbi:MAG: zinc dependent phospholipase C family protein [Clostridiaceae bacterium]
MGDGVIQHGLQEASSESDISIQWQSGGWNHTHQFIVARGLTILENDKGWSIAQYFYAENGTALIMEYSDKPDVDETDGITPFLGHFYDPDTGTNYLGGTDPTARARFSTHFYTAVNYYNNNNKTEAWKSLGRALHYYGDLSEPHHASNLIVGLSRHGEFESWVDTNRTDFGVTTSNRYDYCLNSDIGTIAFAAALNAKSYVSGAESTLTSDMRDAASNTVRLAQEFTAGVLYKFLNEVGEI